MIKLTITEKTVDKKIIDGIKKKIDQKTTEVVNEANKKTIVYASWSLAGILLMLLQLPKILFYILSFAMIGFAFYLLFKFFKSMMTVLNFISDFDEEIKKFVSIEIKKATEESLKSKIGLKLSGRNNTDIENLCISHFIRELARRFKKHKWIIMVRVIAYTVAVLLFKEILFKILM